MQHGCCACWGCLLCHQRILYFDVNLFDLAFLLAALLLQRFRWHRLLRVCRSKTRRLWLFIILIFLLFPSLCLLSFEGRALLNCCSVWFDADTVWRFRVLGQCHLSFVLGSWWFTQDLDLASFLAYFQVVCDLFCLLGCQGFMLGKGLLSSRAFSAE